MAKKLQGTSCTFRDMIEGSFLYVDKTRYFYELIRPIKGTYFVSRPRRFGKSLAISTIEEIFSGDKELFQGLWIHDSDYQWKTYPVIRLDFGADKVNTATRLEEVIQEFLEEVAKQYGLTLKGSSYLSLFRNLVHQLAQAHNGKVVLLVDEYDKPIVDNLDNLEEAKEIRDVLRGFYGVAKALDRYWRFVFITGISKFSRVGVFSTMNNLDDLTLDYRFADALGITEAELRHYFQEHIDEFAQKKKITSEELLAQIRRWYDGFRFAPEGQNLYNPFSTIQLFLKQRFYNYWFATGTPSFLIKLLREQEYDITALDGVEIDALAFDTYELDNLAIHPLFFQTGYLTIKDFEEDEFGHVFTLSYPNYEVEQAFVTYLLNDYNKGDITLTDSHLRRLLRALQAKDLKQFFQILNIFFANVDYDLHIKQEKYYQTIFYMIFLLLGLKISAEMKTNQGRVDAVIELKDDIFIFEFKLDDTASTALQQSKDKEYAEKYRLHGKTITLVGANFDYGQRKVTEWKHEQDDTTI